MSWYVVQTALENMAQIKKKCSLKKNGQKPVRPQRKSVGYGQCNSTTNALIIIEVQISCDALFHALF